MRIWQKLFGRPLSPTSTDSPTLKPANPASPVPESQPEPRPTAPQSPALVADDLPPDPVMSEMDAMMNAAANVLGYQQSNGIRFIERGGKIAGIWVRAFPGNTTKRKFLAMYCAMQKQDVPHETILLGQYDISKNTEQGGFDVLLR